MLAVEAAGTRADPRIQGGIGHAEKGREAACQFAAVGAREQPPQAMFAAGIAEPQPTASERIGRLVANRAAERGVGRGADVGVLGNPHRGDVLVVHERAGLLAAAIHRIAIRQAVHHEADLRGIRAVAHAANVDAGGPVVAAYGIALGDVDARQAVEAAEHVPHWVLGLQRIAAHGVVGAYFAHAEPFGASGDDGLVDRHRLVVIGRKRCQRQQDRQ